MNDVRLHEAMDAIAAGAPAPPADLLDRVEAGRRRQRGTRTAVAGVAAVIQGGAAWAALGPSTYRADLPAGRTEYAPFHLPASVEAPPLFWNTWVSAMLGDQEPSATPDGKPVRVVDRIDDGFFLMGSADTFYTWTPLDRVLRPMMSSTGVDATAHPDWIVVTPRWIVWLADDRGSPGEFSIWRTPHGGGSRYLVAVVHQDTSGVHGLYATDDHVYWSTRGDRAVHRLSQAHVTMALMPGFDGMTTDGTPWARGPGSSVFRNLVTGEVRTVAPAEGVDAAAMQCIPAFCLAPSASDGRRWFLQRPDGSHRTELPYPGRPAIAGAMGESGLLLVDGRVLLDPDSGRLGIATRDRQDGCPARAAGNKGEVSYRFAVRTPNGCGPRGFIAISASD
jgi:hypothetical protein